MKTMSMSAFQSTHPRGVRRFKDDVSVCLGVFQSTHPRGVRPDERYHQSEHRRISIHAPARGATSKGAEHFHDHFDFNPRTREGCDHIGRRAVYRYLIFQSTHPRGVRLKRCHTVVRAALYFNPRTREGCDSRAFTTARGYIVNFNPRTREGCDLISLES